MTAQIDNDELPHDGGAMGGDEESLQPPGDASAGPVQAVLSVLPSMLGRFALGLAVPLILLVILAFLAQMIASGH